MVKPEDTYELIALVGTTEVELKPQGATDGVVPADRVARKIYGYFLNNQASAANTLTLRIYKGTTIEKEITITLGAYDTIDERKFPDPWLTVPAGRTVKAVASAASVMVILQCYDI